MIHPPARLTRLTCMLLLALAPIILFPKAGLTQNAPLTTPAEARAWYIAMMRAHGCQMTAYQVSDAMEAAYPYANPTTRISQNMAVDEGVVMVGEGLIVLSGAGAIRYIGPGGC